MRSGSSRYRSKVTGGRSFGIRTAATRPVNILSQNWSSSAASAHASEGRRGLDSQGSASDGQGVGGEGQGFVGMYRLVRRDAAERTGSQKVLEGSPLSREVHTHVGPTVILHLAGWAVETDWFTEVPRCLLRRCPAHPSQIQIDFRVDRLGEAT